MKEWPDDVAPSIYRFPELLHYLAVALARRAGGAWRTAWHEGTPRLDECAAARLPETPASARQQVLGAWSLAGFIAAAGFIATLML